MPPSDLTQSGTSTGLPPAASVRRYADRAAAWLARRERALWGLVLLALLADVGTTVVGLHAGHAEGNPIVAGLLAGAGLGGFLALKGVVLAAAVAMRLALPQFRVVIPVGTALPWLGAAAVNAGLLLFAA